jgi:hypothetical protein
MWPVFQADAPANLAMRGQWLRPRAAPSLQHMLSSDLSSHFTGSIFSGRCSCIGSYAGSVSASTSSPIFTSACSALTCLVNSEGASVPSDTHTMQAMLDK